MKVPRLLAIGDRERIGGLSRYADWAARARAAGVEALLIREKDLDDRQLFELCLAVRAAAPPPARVLVSGRADLAAISRLDGVHLPGAGVPASVARSILGAGRLVGRSTHSVEEVRVARLEGVDYVFFGPVRQTPSKPGVAALGFGALAEAASQGLPVLALGGLEAADYAAVRNAGAHGLAAIGAFLPDRIHAATEAIGAIEAIEAIHAAEALATRGAAEAT